MKEYSYRQSPIELHGVPFFQETGRLERLPAQLREELPNLNFLGRRCPGARVCFRTNSRNVKVKVVFETLSLDIGMSLYSCQSAYIYIGERSNSRYAGHAFPREGYDSRFAERVFTKSDEIEDVTVWLPRNEIIADVIIGLDEDAQLLPPTPYRYPLPILYYGSSITEGGCSSKISTCYNSLISRWLDVDFYNFGFSGSAKGELAMADYINTIDKSIFVLDYDHNAPSVEHLWNTHEPFFKRIREENPDLPVVMMTMPDYQNGEEPLRREVIRTTYEHALAAGDRNVYFVDGGEFFPPELVSACSNDNTHPNDLGFYFMAKKIAPVIEEILGGKK